MPRGSLNLAGGAPPLTRHFLSYLSSPSPQVVAPQAQGITHRIRMAHGFERINGLTSSSSEDTEIELRKVSSTEHDDVVTTSVFNPISPNVQDDEESNDEFARKPYPCSRGCGRFHADLGMSKYSWTKQGLTKSYYFSTKLSKKPSVDAKGFTRT